MCGILTYFNSKGIDQQQLEQALKSLKSVRHRGPNGEGVLLVNTRTGEYYNLITDETPTRQLPSAISMHEAGDKSFNLLLGHRRLSIIDVSVNGHQPMTYTNGNWIIFNGEVYNYRELREELQKEGLTFKTSSDTEVIHAAYEHWGERCVERFNGMFSIVLFDNKRKKLFITNDRYAVKPLYFYKDLSRYILASELRQFRQFDIPLTPNKEYLLDYLKNGYEDYDSNTVWSEVQRFGPACYELFDLNNPPADIKPQRYYFVKTESRKISDKDAIAEFNFLFNDAVKLRLRSDVPVGFACSGGLDSSAILYSAVHTQKLTDVSTFSAVFPGKEGDESYFINLIEKDLKLKHYHVHPVDEFTFENFEKHVDSLEFPPQSTSFFSENCVYKLVNEKNIKVLLIGQGSDEILAGYHHHFYRYCRSLIMRGRILEYLSGIRSFSRLKGMNASHIHKLVLMDVVLILKFKSGLRKISSSLEDRWHSVNKLVDILKLDLTEAMLPNYLRTSDRDSMAYGVESRPPFMDYRLVDFCMTLPDNLKIRDGWQKWILRQADVPMPEEIRYRKDKKGFTTPQDEWIRNFRRGFEDYLKYIPEDMASVKTPDEFRLFGLGVWYKLNQK